MLWCPILPERQRKFEMIMHALAAGWRDGARICYGRPPDDNEPVALYGQAWGTEILLHQASATGRRYWHIDNGFFRPGRGRPNGYYRFCWCGMQPRSLHQAPAARARALNLELVPWRRDGAHILLALPGADFGRGIGLNMAPWIAYARAELPRRTRRPIVVRERSCPAPLAHHFRNCWAVVTHSSNIAVDAVLAGIPVFVAPSSSAAPVGNLDWDCLERPAMPDREAWINSLACQQFTVAEMADGTAFDYLLAHRHDAA